MSAIVIPTNLVIFTGRLRSGKDHAAQIMGLTPIPLAEPLYEICISMLGDCNKRNPLHRRFLQLLGAWGRGETGEHPELPEAKEVAALITKSPEKLLSEKHTKLNIDWETFGNPDFWIKIGVEKTKALMTSTKDPRLAIPNGRFPNELMAFQKLGFIHMHVVCSEHTRRARAGGDNNAEIENDTTELFAKYLDENMFGPMVLWNDPYYPVPSNTGWQKI